MLALKNIEVKIGKKTILDNVTFEADKGINVILGPNGSGKTTILRSIIGVIKVVRGEIIIKGSLSYVPSEFFSPSMRVIDVILSGNKRVDYDYYIKQLNIEDFLERDFSTLS
ncbi:iron ABC transporter ATP-binding protein, partial [Sulfolobus sp. A20-N-F6]